MTARDPAAAVRELEQALRRERERVDHYHDKAAALVQQLQEARQSNDTWTAIEYASRTRVERLEEALRRVQLRQVARLEALRADGVVFDEMPHHDPSNWQQVAFWIYTDLCEVETIAREALAGGGETTTTKGEA